MADLPGLALKTALASGLIGAGCGLAVGLTGALLVLAYVVPVGVGLALVDWRTTLLPTRVIAPSYAVVVALVLIAALVDQDLHALVRAGIGWLVWGGLFFVLWFVYPRGMGYGDVRLSGLLGLALGYLGWQQTLVGVYAAFLLGGLGGLVLSLLRIVSRKRYPFGPFMLLGALVGVLAGASLMSGLGY
jgi:leader peptidase (prepilin peptidase)/N-methyltransferase